MDEKVVQFGIIYKFTIIDTDYTFNGNKNIFYVFIYEEGKQHEGL